MSSNFLRLVYLLRQCRYKEQELINLRGTGLDMLKEWDTVYDYAYYNDLGLPDKEPKYARPVLGGSQEYPYPRRGRTGRKPTKTYLNTEKRLFLLSLNIYVPRYERSNHVKFSDLLDYAVKSIGQMVVSQVFTDDGDRVGGGYVACGVAVVTMMARWW
ncbi:hypothetical protein L1887_38535 [Cichorium endivia]|nr:hypothetical protein L1887_38535 [Cichorium endivia]